MRCFLPLPLTKLRFTPNSLAKRRTDGPACAMVSEVSLDSMKVAGLVSGCKLTARSELEIISIGATGELACLGGGETLTGLSI